MTISVSKIKQWYRLMFLTRNMFSSDRRCECWGTLPTLCKVNCILFSNEQYLIGIRDGMNRHTIWFNGEVELPGLWHQNYAFLRRQAILQMQFPPLAATATPPPLNLTPLLHFLRPSQSTLCGFQEFRAPFFPSGFLLKTAEINSRRNKRRHVTARAFQMFFTSNLLGPANEVLSLWIEMSSHHNQPSL